MAWSKESIVFSGISCKQMVQFLEMEKPKEEEIWVGTNRGKMESSYFRYVQFERHIRYIRHVHVPAKGTVFVKEPTELWDLSVYVLDPKL